MSVPDYCEPIIGWRGWRISRNSPLLRSEHDASSWEPFKSKVAVHHDVYRAQQWQCAAGESPPCAAHTRKHPGCGIYAFKGVRDLLKYWKYRQNPIIVGQVALWGRYVEHEHGWRAQFAYPVKFVAADLIADHAYYDTCTDRELSVELELAKTYGVPYEEDLSCKLELRSSTESLSHYAALSRYASNPSIPSSQWANPRSPNQYVSLPSQNLSQQVADRETGLSIRIIKSFNFIDDGA